MLLISLSLVSCASGENWRRTRLRVVDGASPSLQSDLAANERAYRVGPFDVLNVNVFGSEELSQQEIQVDASGRLTFPLIGTLEVAGKTPGEVSAMMATVSEDAL